LSQNSGSECKTWIFKKKKGYYTKREFVSGETHKLERAMKFLKKG
jgi:hypothetical protein